MKWTEQDKEDLLLGSSIGLPYKEIAEILGRATNTVKRKLYVLKHPSKVLEYRKANKEEAKEYADTYRDKNKEVLRSKNKEYYSRNTDRIKLYRASNKDRTKEYNATYRAENVEKIKAHKQVNNAFYCSKRRAAKLQATPGWADLEGIKKFYKGRPKDCHVDHVVPLQGKNICGLHTLENLQYLVAKDNLAKGNKFDG